MALGPAAAAGGGEEMAAGRALPPQRPPQAEPPRSPLRGGGGTVRGGRWTGSLRRAGRAGGPRAGGGWPEAPQLFSSGPTAVPGGHTSAVEHRGTFSQRSKQTPQQNRGNPSSVSHDSKQSSWRVRGAAAHTEIQCVLGQSGEDGPQSCLQVRAGSVKYRNSHQLDF